jgi:hypothetical protein
VTKENGFLQLRRGLWEHIRDGRMSITEGLAFVYICSQADTRTGIWKGCAKSLCGELGVPERTARDVLEKMEHGDYIRRFAVPGRHSCYPILVHKFEITQGEHDGEQLNALDSGSPTELAYFSREQNGERGVKHGVEHGAAQRRSKNREGRSKKNHAAKAAPPPDPRHQPFIEFAFQTYKAKHARAPIWLPKEYAGLKTVLRTQSPDHLTVERLMSLWRNFLASTEAFTMKQGDSLGYFCANVDKFSEGPIMQAKGKSNGRDINDAVATTMQGYAVNSGITH